MARRGSGHEAVSHDVRAPGAARLVGLCGLLLSALRVSRNSQPPYLYAGWLSRENEARRLHAAQELGEQDSDLDVAIAALDTALLDDASPAVRKRSAESLARLFWMQPKAKALSGPAVDALVQALADESPAVRAAAATALGQICPDPATAIPALLRAARDEDIRVRGEAVAALGLIEGAAASPKFAAALLKDRDVPTRRSAVAALVRWGDLARLVRSELTEALTDPDEAVRAGAARALTGTDVIPLGTPARDDPDTAESKSPRILPD